MSGDEQATLTSMREALRKASLGMFAPDRDALLQVAISRREQASEKAAPQPSSVPA